MREKKRTVACNVKKNLTKMNETLSPCVKYGLFETGTLPVYADIRFYKPGLLHSNSRPTDQTCVAHARCTDLAQQRRYHSQFKLPFKILFVLHFVRNYDSLKLINLIMKKVHDWNHNAFCEVTNSECKITFYLTKIKSTSPGRWHKW